MPPPLDNQPVVRAIVASQLAPPFMFSGVAVVLPAMGDELSAGAVSIGLVETLFLAGHLGFLLPVGRLADASDRVSLYRLGFLGFGLSSLAIALLPSMPAILALRFVQGIASAVFSATGPAILADLVPPAQRGRAYGSAIGANYVGLTLGPICAGAIGERLGWRAVFVVGAALLLVGYVFLKVRAPSTWRRPTAPVHLPSTALIVASVLLLVAGTATLRAGAIGVACLVAGLASGAAFLALQRRLERPLVDTRALASNAVLRRTLLAQLLIYMNGFTTVFMLSIFMQVVLGHSSQTSGQVLAIGSVLMAVVAPIAGTLSDRARPRVVASVGVAFALAAAALATTLEVGAGLGLVALVLGLQGLGFALFSSPNVTMLMNSVPPSEVSMASALGAKARSLGMVAGMLVTALLIALEIGEEPVAQHPAAFVGLMGTTFAALTVATALALVVSALGGGRERS